MGEHRVVICFFFFSSRRRHTRCSRDWSSDVCSSDLSTRDLEPWTCGRGTGLDAGSHDAAGTHSERSENQHQASPQGTLRLSRLHVRTASLPEGWPLVSWGQSVEEERSETPAKGGRPLDTQQRGDLA